MTESPKPQRRGETRCLRMRDGRHKQWPQADIPQQLTGVGGCQGSLPVPRLGLFLPASPLATEAGKSPARPRHVLAQAPGHGRLPAPQAATPPQPRQGAAGQALGRRLLPLSDPEPPSTVPPGPREHPRLRTAPPARSAPRSPARGGARTSSRPGLRRPAPRRSPPAGPASPTPPAPGCSMAPRPARPPPLPPLPPSSRARRRRPPRSGRTPYACACALAAGGGGGGSARRTPAPAAGGSLRVPRPRLQRCGLPARLPARGVFTRAPATSGFSRRGASNDDVAPSFTVGSQHRGLARSRAVASSLHYGPWWPGWEGAFWRTHGDGGGDLVHGR